MTRQHSALLLGVLTSLSLVGCGTTTSGGVPAPAVTSGIEGRTMVDGGCPLMREESPCPDRLLSAHLTITAANSAATVAETDSDADGHFRIVLPPGRYTIHPTNRTGAVVPVAQPSTVTVDPGRFTSVTIPFDSGIR